MRIRVVQDEVAALEGNNGMLHSVVFKNGERLRRDSLFFCTGHRQHSPELIERLGCNRTEQGSVWVGNFEMTCVEGVYCCGDASHNAQLVIVAAAEGAVAACAINKALTEEYRQASKELHVAGTD